jgi:hypothetical protein
MSAAATQRLIAQCKQIAAIFDETMPNTAIDANAHRVGGINPYYNRTTSGLYLEFYYGYPSKIWTPGGYWAMTGSTVTHGGHTAEAVVAPFMARLTTRLHEPQQHSPWGCYGPVYAILAVDGEPVDEPGDVIHFAKDGYSEIKAEWADLAEVSA